MAHCLVTGVAGFIGSQLAERLLEEGHAVSGLDCLTDNYARSLKETNLRPLLAQSGFRFSKVDLGREDLRPHLRGIEVIFHQAGQPGVRASWGSEFEVYLHNNVTATQRLLEAALQVGDRLRRFVNASSSSVYGQSDQLPLCETTTPRPYSPYGVTKLAAEHLCYLYHCNYGLPTVSLRYFTAYGPRQRPDMAFHRFIRAMRQGDSIDIYGDGEQTRDFTYIDDVVEANLLTMERGSPGEVYNIGGGSRVTVNEVIRTLEELTGVEAQVVHAAPQRGDVRDTWADTTKARDQLAFIPRTKIEEGLRLQVEWLSSPA